MTQELHWDSASHRSSIDSGHIERKYGREPMTRSPLESSTTQDSSLNHEALLTNLRSAMKALGGATTPLASGNRFISDEGSICRLSGQIPRMTDLDSVALSVERVDHVLCSASDLDQSQVSSIDQEIPEASHGGLQSAVDSPVTELEKTRAELEDMTMCLQERKSVLDDLDADIESKTAILARLDAKLVEKNAELQGVETTLLEHRRQLDSLEQLAQEGEKLVEDQSFKASNALEQLGRLDEDLANLQSHIIEAEARLDAKKAMIREVAALEDLSKNRSTEIDGQRALLSELKKNNEAALSQRKALSLEIEQLKKNKKALSFDLEPALNEAIRELEASKQNVWGSAERAERAEYELELQREKADRLAAALQKLASGDCRDDATSGIEPDVPDREGSRQNDEMVRRSLFREWEASKARTTSLFERSKTWSSWRPTRRTMMIRANY
jgi:DNA repair exonuclease SbcCD ATPase subunit